MLNNTPDSFDEDSALNYLRAKYGTKESGKDHPKKKGRETAEEPQPSASSSRKSSRKRNAKDTPHGGGNPDTSQDFIPKKYEIVTVEENRPLVEAIREMGVLYFKRNEPRKGGSYFSILTCRQTMKIKYSSYFRNSFLHERGEVPSHLPARHHRQRICHGFARRGSFGGQVHRRVYPDGGCAALRGTALFCAEEVGTHKSEAVLFSKSSFPFPL